MLVRLVIPRYHQMTTIVHCKQNLMYVTVCEYVCMYMCIYFCIIIKTCDKLSSTDTSSKQ